MLANKSNWYIEHTSITQDKKGLKPCSVSAQAFTMMFDYRISYILEKTDLMKKKIAGWKVWMNILPENAWVNVGLVLIQSFLFDAKELCFFSVLLLAASALRQHCRSLLCLTRIPQRDLKETHGNAVNCILLHHHFRGYYMLNETTCSWAEGLSRGSKSVLQCNCRALQAAVIQPLHFARSLIHCFRSPLSLLSPSSTILIPSHSPRVR